MKLAKKIIRLFPPHKTYVEPFCGSAAVALAKKPSEKDVISDIDDFAFCYSFLKNASDETISTLEKMDWQAKPSLYNKLKNFAAKTPIERFRKFFYIRRHTYGTKAHGIMNPQPTKVNNKKFRMLRDGLKHIDVFQDDYKKIVQKYDSPDTLFFFDPPYHQSWGKEWGMNKFDFKEFSSMLKKIKGKFLLTYEDDKEVRGLLNGFKMKKVEVPRMLDGTNNPQKDYDLLVFNYNPVPNTTYLSEELEGINTLLDFVDFDESDEDTYILRIPADTLEEFEEVLIQSQKPRVLFTDPSYSPVRVSDIELQDDIASVSLMFGNENYDTFPGWDSEGTEIKYRVKDPALFEKDSFRRKNIKTESPKVAAVMARLKGGEALTIQSLRFPKKEGWTVEKAQAWYKTRYKDNGDDIEKYTDLLDKMVKEALTRTAEFTIATGETFNSLKAQVKSGLYMPESYVVLIKEGNATMVVKAREYGNMVNKPLWLCDDKRVHAVIKLTDCKKVESVDEFNSFADKHKMDDAARIKNFGKDRTEFYLYSVALLTKLPEPVPYQWKSGIQGFVKEVAFLKDEGGE